MLAVQLDDAAVFLKERWKARLAAVFGRAGHARPPAARGAQTRARRLDPATPLWMMPHTGSSVHLAPGGAARLQCADCAGACQDPGFRFQAAAVIRRAAVGAFPTTAGAPVAAGFAGQLARILLAAADAAIAALDTDPPAARRLHLGPGQCGSRIRHPLCGALPGLGTLIDMPVKSLPGPRHAAVVVAASCWERFGVSPGHEDEAYLRMYPGGQSGMPLSPAPNFRAGFHAWAFGEPVQFLPGVADAVLTLVPDPP